MSTLSNIIITKNKIMDISQSLIISNARRNFDNYFFLYLLFIYFIYYSSCQILANIAHGRWHLTLEFYDYDYI